MTAARYAISNLYGSELLTTALRLYKKMRTLKSSELESIRTSYSLALSYANKHYEPILVKIEGLSVQSLKSETGDDPDDTIRLMQETADKGLKVMWQQFNFELIAPIHSDNLIFYRIHRTNDDEIFPQYELELLRARGAAQQVVQPDA